MIHRLSGHIARLLLGAGLPFGITFRDRGMMPGDENPFPRRGEGSGPTPRLLYRIAALPLARLSHGTLSFGNWCMQNRFRRMLAVIFAIVLFSGAASAE